MVTSNLSIELANVILTNYGSNKYTEILQRVILCAEHSVQNTLLLIKLTTTNKNKKEYFNFIIPPLQYSAIAYQRCYIHYKKTFIDCLHLLIVAIIWLRNYDGNLAYRLVALL